MTLFLSFNRFLPRVESWNGWHMLLFPRKHVAVFSNDFGWKIYAILRELNIHHSLFFVDDAIYVESTVKQWWIPCVLFVFYLSKTLPHTSHMDKHTHMKICKHTHCHTCSSAHKEVKTHQKEALPTSCLVSSLQAMVSVCTSTTEAVWSLKLLHLSHRTLLNLANRLKTFPWYSFTSTVLRSTTNRAQTVWQIHDESLSAAKWIWVLNQGMKRRK